MQTDFKYIRNRISEYEKDAVFGICYDLLDKHKYDKKPIWDVFLLIKWTHLYGGKRYPCKAVDERKVLKLLGEISKLNLIHLNTLLDDKIDKFFTTIFYQQFYLQEKVNTWRMASQLKLYKTLSNNNYYNNLFKTLTGIEISDFLRISYMTVLLMHTDEFEISQYRFNGKLDNKLRQILLNYFTEDLINKFIDLLLIKPDEFESQISVYKKRIKSAYLENLEQSFFTLNPLHLFRNDVKVIHHKIMYYSNCFYIYDFLNHQSQHFSTEFGRTFELYVKESLLGYKIDFIDENEIKLKLNDNSNLIDFQLIHLNIFIECKAIEVQSIATINPTNDVLFITFKKTIIKAYLKQLYTVSEKLSKNNLNWGIIITYKKLYWSYFHDFRDILSENNINISEYDNSHLPPSNVFIIDLFTWDKLLYLIDTKQVNVLDLFEKIKEDMIGNNRKMFIDMYFDEFDFSNFKPNHLIKEYELFEIKSIR